MGDPPRRPGGIRSGFAPEQWRCKARSKQTGERCKNWTKTVDVTLCHYHGGNAGQTLKAGARRRIMAETEAFLDKYDIDPLDNPWEALALLATRILEAERIMAERIGNLTEADVGSPEVAAWERYLQLASKIVTDASKLDLDERKLHLNQAQASLVLRAVSTSLGDLTQALLAQLPTSTHQHIERTIKTDFPRILATHLRGRDTGRSDTQVDAAPNTTHQHTPHSIEA